MKRLLLTLVLAGILAGCGSHPSSSALGVAQAQSATPGNLTFTWTAPTNNTDGSAITGTLSYTIYNMAPCGGTSCSTDETVLGAVASGLTGTSYTSTAGFPDGNYCFAIQANEVLPNGANVSSALSVIDPNSDCAIVAGSLIPQPVPMAPGNFKAQV